MNDVVAEDGVDIEDGKYTVMRNGFIWSNIRNKFLKQSCSNGGHLNVVLNGKTKNVNRVVAKAFLPNPENKSIVLHLDGNIHNNAVDNLRWCTPLESQMYKEEHSLKCKTSKFKKVRYGGVVYNSMGELATMLSEKTGAGYLGIRRQQ